MHPLHLFVNMFGFYSFGSRLIDGYDTPIFKKVRHLTSIFALNLPWLAKTA